MYLLTAYQRTSTVKGYIRTDTHEKAKCVYSEYLARRLRHRGNIVPVLN